MTSRVAEPTRGRAQGGAGRLVWAPLGLGVTLLLGTGAVFAQSPSESPGEAADAAAPADGPTGDAETSPPSEASVQATRARLERSMQALEASAARAQTLQSQDGGASAGCMDALRLRGSDVMEVATGELLVLNDGEASAEAQAFAHAKLEAAAAELEKLETGAPRCFGEGGPGQGAAQNTVDEPRVIPLADPTLASVQSPVPPPVDIYSPVMVASPSV